MRLFLDANVLFTAAHDPGGKAVIVIEAGIHGNWELVSSAYALEEARRNLQRKFPTHLVRLEIFSHALRLAPHQENTPYPKGLPEKDRPIFQAALGCRATHLLTGDLKDFGCYMNKPKATHGMLIQTVADFLGSLN